MSRITLLIIALLTCYELQAIGKPPELIVRGNKRFSTREIQQFARDVLDKPAAAIAETISDSLIARDFLFATVTASDEAQDDSATQPVLTIDEGPLAEIATLTWTGDSARVPPSVHDRLLLRPGANFSWGDLRHDIELILEGLSNSGYPLAQVELERVTTHTPGTRLDVLLRVQSGAYTEIEFVEFAGGKATSPRLLQRTARTNPPLVYSDESLRLARQRLKRLDFVESVATPELVLARDGRSGIRFDIVEARSTMIDAVAGFVPKEGDSGSELTGLVHVDALNLFGTGRRAKVYWDRPNARVQAVELAYREPWLFGSPISLNGKFAQRVEDTLYVSRVTGLGADMDIGLGFRIAARLNSESIFVDSAASVATGIPKQNTVYFESELSVDTRDVPLNPREGVYFSTFAGTGSRTWTPVTADGRGGDYSIRRSGVDGEIAYEFLPFWVADVAAHARVFTSDEPEVLISDMYRVGGARTIRGYREEQFLGDRAGWSNVELRYLLGVKSRLLGFADFGAIHGPDADGRFSTQFISSAGLGLRVETRLGIAGFDYGIGQHDHLLSGKVHFSLSTQF